MYRKDFDDNRFQVQLETISEYCKGLDIISVRTIAEILKNLKIRSHLTGVIKLAKLILVMPAINSTSERLYSLLNLIKTSCYQQRKHAQSFRTKYSRMDQVTFVEDSL